MIKLLKAQFSDVLLPNLGEIASRFQTSSVYNSTMIFVVFAGLNIAQSNFGACQAISSIFVFSISSPIGIGIGMVLANMEKSLAGDIANGILQVSHMSEIQTFV